MYHSPVAENRCPTIYAFFKWKRSVGDQSQFSSKQGLRVSHPQCPAYRTHCDKTYNSFHTFQSLEKRKMFKMNLWSTAGMTPDRGRAHVSTFRARTFWCGTLRFSYVKPVHSQGTPQRLSCDSSHLSSRCQFSDLVRNSPSSFARACSIFRSTLRKEIVE